MRWTIFLLFAAWTPLALTLGEAQPLGAVDYFDVLGEGAVFLGALVAWFALPRVGGLSEISRSRLSFGLPLLCLAQLQDVFDEFFHYEALLPHVVENLSMVLGATMIMFAVLHLSSHVRAITTEQRRILDESVRDPLTGLLNRTTLDDTLQEATDRAGTGEAVALIYVDLDGFKVINDRFGHVHGDAVIRRMARTIAQAVRVGDRAFRIGGDEFIVILFGTSLDDARAVAERIGEGFRRIDGDSRETASFGVVVCGPDETPAGFLARGDAALYAAKDGGRDRVVLGEHELTEVAGAERAAPDLPGPAAGGS